MYDKRVLDARLIVPATTSFCTRYIELSYQDETRGAEVLATVLQCMTPKKRNTAGTNDVHLKARVLDRMW